MSATNGNGVEDAAVRKVSELDGEAPESTDFANYFCTYAFLYHQKVRAGTPAPEGALRARRRPWGSPGRVRRSRDPRPPPRDPLPAAPCAP